MSTTTSFAIRRFKNKSGAISWRLSGWLAGARIRKNFKTREEAAAEKATQEIRALQVISGLRSGSTFLTDVQLREAEDAFRRLSGRSQSLLFYIDYGLANYHEHGQQKALAEAVIEYIAVKSKELARTLISTCQMRAIKNELKVLQAHFPTGSVSQFTASNLTTYLERGNPSLKTYNNRRGILSTFFKFSCQKEWVATNLVEKTPYHRINHRRGSAVTITAEQANELMAFLEDYKNGRLVPYFALCLFAGIRPSPRDGEIARLQTAHIRLDTGVVIIEPEVSKVRMKRMVKIQPNLAAWLQAYPFTPIKPAFIEYHRAKITERFNLSYDVLRHTFISMFVAKFRSMGEAALQAGNSESIIRKHYLDLKSTEEAEQFFGILPKKVFRPQMRTEPSPAVAFSPNPEPLPMAG
jgi:integrase